MTQPQAPHDFQGIFNQIERHIEGRYGIPVMISDVLDPNTGDLDGACIKVDYDQELDAALFVLIHLFGHTVQWNNSDEYRQLGLDSQPGKSEEELARVFVYERDATRYSLQLLHDIGVHSLDRWVTEWWYADWRYLEHFYRTGEKLDFRSLLVPDQSPEDPEYKETLTPLPIPHFVPQRWISRWSF